MPRVRVRPKARREIVEIALNLIERAGPENARRFRLAVIETCRRLAQFPDLGAPKQVRTRKYAGIRMIQVRGFSNYLMFYFSRDKEISIERVFHAKQDYLRMLQ